MYKHSHLRQGNSPHIWHYNRKGFIMPVAGGHAGKLMFLLLNITARGVIEDNCNCFAKIGR
jgi:hypothetical protein